ncbi:MAG: hypothetical protein ACRBBM_12585 [Pseudomonadaceae bacterium]
MEFRQALIVISATALLLGAHQASARPDVTRDHCLAEWPGDVEMQHHCVIEQTRANTTLQKYSGPIRERCESEWGVNFEMVMYCVKEQTAAQKRVATTPKDEIAAYCAGEWPEDYGMREYCENEQRAAKARLEGQSGRLLQRCQGEWGVQYNMVEYCLEEGL